MRYGFPLSFQTVLPDDYRANAVFRAVLETLRELSFWGIELNMSDPARFDVTDVRAFLGEYDLELAMLATGLTAKTGGFSLSDATEEVREKSVVKCRQMIDWVAGSKAGIIIGFLKGGVVPDGVEARKRFARSLAEVVPHAEKRSVALLVEATNRYESSVANSVDDSVALVHGYGAACAQVLPDTFHMNIEEVDMFASLRRHRGRFSSFHLSDNNRFFPGLGAMDFGRIIRFLKEIDYRGRLAIEGNVRNNVEGDLRASMARLGPLLEA